VPLTVPLSVSPLLGSAAGEIAPPERSCAVLCRFPVRPASLSAQDRRLLALHAKADPVLVSEAETAAGLGPGSRTGPPAVGGFAFGAGDSFTLGKRPRTGCPRSLGSGRGLAAFPRCLPLARGGAGVSGFAGVLRSGLCPSLRAPSALARPLARNGPPGDRSGANERCRARRLHGGALPLFRFGRACGPVARRSSGVPTPKGFDRLLRRRVSPLIASQRASPREALLLCRAASLPRTVWPRTPRQSARTSHHARACGRKPKPRTAAPYIAGSYSAARRRDTCATHRKLVFCNLEAHQTHAPRPLGLGSDCGVRRRPWTPSRSRTGAALASDRPERGNRPRHRVPLLPPPNPRHTAL